jgi:hypothetical protein
VETVEKCEEEAAEKNVLFFFCDPFFNYRMARKIRKLKERISCLCICYIYIYILCEIYCVKKNQLLNRFTQFKIAVLDVLRCRENASLI